MDITVIVPTTPPDIPDPSEGNPYFTVAVISILVAAIVLYYVWNWLGHRGQITHTDIMPTLDDYDSEGVSINAASAVQMIMVLPALGALIWGAMEYNAGGDPITVGAISMGVLFFQMFLIAETRRRTREKNAGMKVWSGWMRSADNSKRKYYWRNVEILTERRLSDEDYASVEEDSGGTWSKERLEEHHIYPVIIDNKHACYVVTTSPEAEAFEWGKSSDWDYFGDFATLETGPELHEIGIVHRVTADELGEETWFQRDEYIRVFYAAWDDKKSIAVRGNLQAIDMTQDEISAQIGVALGIQNKVTAGMINTDRETLMHVLNDQRKLEVMATAIGSGLANGIIEDKDALGTLGKLGESDWLSIATKVIIFVFGVIAGVAFW